MFKWLKKILKKEQKTTAAEIAKTLKDMFIKSIREGGITQVTLEHNSFPGLNLTLKDFQDYAETLKDFINNKSLGVREDDEKNIAIPEIIKFFKILPKEVLQKKNQQQVAEVFLDLLESQTLKITDLLENETSENLTQNEFSKFLQLDDRIVDKYLEELLEKAKESEHQDYIVQQFTSLEKPSLEKIISRIDSVKESSSIHTSLPQLIIPIIKEVTKRSNQEPPENLGPEATEHLNSIFFRYLEQLSKEKNTSNLLEFIREFDEPKTLELLNTNTLLNLVKLIQDIPKDELQDGDAERILKIKQKFESSTHDITVTAAATNAQYPKDSATQNSDATPDPEDNLRKIIESIITNTDYSLVEENTKKDKSKSSTSYEIKDSKQEVVASIEKTPTGSTIRIPEQHTDFLIKILEGLAGDLNTKNISVSGLSKENIESITKNLDEKILENKEEYKQTLKKLIHKLGDEDGNKELVIALKEIQSKHGLDGIIVASSRLSTVENGPYPSNPIPPTVAPLTEPLREQTNRRPKSAQPRRNSIWKPG